MSHAPQFKEKCRARVFELMQQAHQAETTSQRIRRLARRKSSVQEIERFKSDAMRSLQAEQRVASAR